MNLRRAMLRRISLRCASLECKSVKIFWISVIRYSIYLVKSIILVVLLLPFSRVHFFSFLSQHCCIFKNCDKRNTSCLAKKNKKKTWGSLSVFYIVKNCVEPRPISVKVKQETRKIVSVGWSVKSKGFPAPSLSSHAQRKEFSALFWYRKIFISFQRIRDFGHEHQGMTKYLALA